MARKRDAWKYAGSGGVRAPAGPEWLVRWTDPKLNSVAPHHVCRVVRRLQDVSAMLEGIAADKTCELVSFETRMVPNWDDLICLECAGPILEDRCSHGADGYIHRECCGSCNSGAAA